MLLNQSTKWIFKMMKLGCFKYLEMHPNYKIHLINLELDATKPLITIIFMKI